MTRAGLALVLMVGGGCVCARGAEGIWGPLHFSLSFAVSLKLRWEIKRPVSKEERETVKRGRKQTSGLKLLRAEPVTQAPSQPAGRAMAAQGCPGWQWQRPRPLLLVSGFAIGGLGASLTPTAHHTRVQAGMQAVRAQAQDADTLLGL